MSKRIIKPRAQARPAAVRDTQSFFTVEMASSLVYELDDYSLTSGYFGTTSRVPYAWVRPLEVGPLDPRFVDGDGFPDQIEGTNAATGMIKAFLFDTAVQTASIPIDDGNNYGRRHHIVPSVNLGQRVRCWWSPLLGCYELMIDPSGLFFTANYHYYSETGLVGVYNAQLNWTATHVAENTELGITEETQNWSTPLAVSNLMAPVAGYADTPILVRLNANASGFEAVGIPPKLAERIST